MMPMAGNGSRFKQKGYKETKPFIEVSGEKLQRQLKIYQKWSI